MASSSEWSGGRFALHFLFVQQLMALAGTIAWVGSSVGATADSTTSDVERLVAAAAQAEASGDTSKSSALLHDAIRIDPENHVARWQLGQVKVDKQWVPVEEAQRRAAADPLQAEYRERRTAIADNPREQLALAKWCRKKDLTDEALFHWASVLAVDPKNDEALRALDLHWQNGRLMTSQQLVAYKDQLRETKRAAERWAPKIVKWRRSVTGIDAEAREKSLDEIRAIKEIESISPFERIVLGRDARDPHHADECRQIGLAYLEALGSMPAQPATESLTRIAVLAPDQSERTSAIKKLKPRDQHDYVPLLLSALGMPIEATYSVTTGPDGSVHYLRSLYREGADSDVAWDSQHSAIQRDLSDYTARVDLNNETLQVGQRPEAKLRTAVRKANRAAAYQNRFERDAAATESQIAEANKAAETLNSRIVPVLAEVTGESYGDNPKGWWDWWKNKNEYYTSDHPVAQIYTSGSDFFDYTIPEQNPHSCFGKGTPVWTKTGQKAIETIEPGDLVLSQDVNTGELKYKAVMRRTMRPPSPLLKISTGEEELHATAGHVFWVSGVGWRMAKELGDAAVLHGVSKPLKVGSVKPAESGEAYNLIVADFNTYFVGKSGVLAHDITPQRPTQAVLPGILKK